MISRKNVLWWVLAAVLLAKILPVGISVIVGVACLIIYLVTLRLHPFMMCETCGGTGRQHGKVFEWSHRQCTDCGGQGRHRRLGTVAFHSSGPVWAERQAAKARESRPSRPLP